MPRLRILAGPSLHDLRPIHANTNEAVDVSSDVFQGSLAVYIKGFADEEGKVKDSDYFRKRSGVTWSIQMQGARSFSMQRAKVFTSRHILPRPFPT